MMDSDLDETTTRTRLIDTQLVHAGWSRNRRSLLEEFLLKAAENDGTESPLQNAATLMIRGLQEIFGYRNPAGFAGIVGNT